MLSKLLSLQFSIGWLILIAAGVIIGLSWMVTGFPLLNLSVPNAPAISLSLVVVFAVSTLVVLLFIMTSAFHYLGLNDPHQALGLPEGSVRALIALILIVVFIIFGIYLFQTVSAGSGGKVRGLSTTQVLDLGTRALVVEDSTVNPGTYDVTLRVGVTDDGARLAQQILTTVGTLVVAVAGFYFGSSAVAAGRAVAGFAGLTIDSVSPDKISKTDPEIKSKTVSVVGSGFADGAKITLKQSGQADIVGTSCSASPTKVTCTFDLAGKTGKWDVVIGNPGGTAGLKEGGLEVTDTGT